jgi:cytochrome P450 family 142 subfamily A polypeptide 1
MNLLDRDFYAGDPHPALNRLRETEPVYHDSASRLWALTRYEDVTWAEKHPELLSSANGSRPKVGPQHNMIDKDDPEHMRLRRLVYKGFTPRHVAAWDPFVRKATTQLLDAIPASSPVDIVPLLSKPLPTAVIAEMLGMPENADQLQHWADAMLDGADGPENVTPEVLDAFAKFCEYASEVIADRTERPRDDIMSILAHAEIDGDSLAPDELLGEALLILVGGNDTTRHVITGAVEALARRPEQRRALAADPSRIPVAVEECIRWVSPVFNMARTATRDVERHGRTIPAGDQVLLSYQAANRDPRVFADPDTFDAARDPNPQIAFGLGTHFCLGASLARLEVRVVLEELLRRHADWTLADADAPLRRTHTSFIGGIEKLPVAFRM